MKREEELFVVKTELLCKCTHLSVRSAVWYMLGVQRFCRENVSLFQFIILVCCRLMCWQYVGVEGLLLRSAGLAHCHS